MIYDIQPIGLLPLSRETNKAIYERVSETSYSVCNCEVEEIYHFVGGRKIVKILQ